MYYSGLHDKIVLSNLSAIHWPNGKIPVSNIAVCGLDNDDPHCKQTGYDWTTITRIFFNLLLIILFIIFIRTLNNSLILLVLLNY